MTLAASQARLGRLPWGLVAGDVIALALFAPIGLLSHDEGITLAGISRNAGPIVGGWLIVAVVARAYVRRSPRRTVVSWAAGVSLGVVVRGVLLDRPLGAGYVTFWGVTLAVTGIFLGLWRLLHARGGARRVVSRPV